MSEVEFIASLPASGDWKFERQGSKLVATDTSGKNPTMILERGKASSRTSNSLLAG